MSERRIAVPGRLSGESQGINLGPLPGFNSLVATGNGQIDWDGTGPISGATDNSLVGMVSWWMYRTNNSFTTSGFNNLTELGGGGPSCDNISNRLVAAPINQAGSNDLIIIQTTNQIPLNQWTHYLLSYNSPTFGNIAINGRVVPPTELTGNTINATSGGAPWNIFNFRIYRTISGANAFYGFYLNQFEALDLSFQSNIEKFITPQYTPAQLGPDGSNPTGSQPLLYLDNPLATVLNNRGTGGNPQRVVALTDSGHGPASPARFAHENNITGYLDQTMTNIGAGDTQVLTLSAWFQSITGGAASLIFAHDGVTTFLDIGHTAGTLITYTFRNQAGTVILEGTSNTATPYTRSAWHHVLLSINMAAATGADAIRMAIDNVDVTQAPTTFVGSESVGLGAAGTSLYLFGDGTISSNQYYSQLWLDFSTFQSVDTPAVRALFVSPILTILPLDLGATGAGPVGTPPHVFLGEGPSYMGSLVQPHRFNVGSGDDFNLTGNWDSAPSNPAQTLFP